MPGVDKHKNSLSIRLTESAVFLRTTDVTGRRRMLNDSQPSMLRGLLVLELVKPTKITSIELELQAKVVTAWPEGIGARRIEVTEEHKLFCAKTVFFRAGSTPRRTSSVGPGINFDDDAGLDDWEIEPHHPDTPRNREEVSTVEVSHNPSYNRPARHSSADSSYFQRSPVYHREDLHLGQIPAYTFVTPPSTSHLEAPTQPLHSPRTPDDPAQTLEDFRNALRADLGTAELTEPRSRSLGHSPGPPVSSSSSVQSYRDTSLSRRPSFEDVPEDDHSHSQSRLSHHSPYSHTPPLSTDSGASSTTGAVESRGRRHSRFSLASVSNVILDAVRPHSPKAAVSRGRREDTTSRDRTANTSVPRSRDREVSTARGRTLEKKLSNQHLASHVEEPKSAFSKFGEILKLDVDDVGDGSKEFKKGTYTYPISFTIPGNSPPSLECNYGNVTWRLKANAHRPGAFKSKLSATREVIVISCPGDEDTEDTENIIVERHWDDQLQYLISISGRSFYIGGTVPITFTLMPLAKIKVHRISVYIEERVDYYTQMKRIARSDPISRIQLLSLKSEGKNASPILPLDSDDVNAFKDSPLYTVRSPDDDLSEMASSLMGPGPWKFHQDLALPNSCSALRFTNKNRRSNISITHLLKCVIRVERGDDEAMDIKTGKRKLFDIVVQTPVQILSCRCNPDWISLPRYTESLEDCSSVTPKCPCEIRRLANAEEHHATLRAHHVLPLTLHRVPSRSSDSETSLVETGPLGHAHAHGTAALANALFDQNTQFERLVSGQESEMGEAPPAYDNIRGSIVVNLNILD